MSGNQTSTTNQTATQTADPRMQAAVAPILSAVPGVAATPYNTQMNPQVAALTPMQQQAIQGFGELQTNNPAFPYINQAALYSNTAADPNNVIRMQQQFYNPMANAVTAQMENVFGQQGAQVLGNAAATGAIGGSRYPIAAENLINQQDLALGQTLSGLQQQALGAAQTQQGQISQQAFTQGQLGQEALGTSIQGINAALLGGQITQQQAQQLLNAAQTSAIQQTLFPQQELGAAANIAGIGVDLGGTSYGTGQTTQPVNYLGQILGAGIAGYGLYRSDERVKENIEPIGKSFDKQTIYKFNYIGDPSPRIGLMAQEVQKKHPGAVKKGPDGIKAVDYNKATEKSVELGEHRQHRAIGGAGIGNGVSGIEGYGGLQNPMQQYFAMTPQVNVPQPHFPTLNLNPQQQGPSQAQQQADQNAKQMMTLGTDLSKGNLGSDIADLFATPQFGARGGRIHRQDGGLLSLSPEDKQNLDYLRGGAPSWLGGDTSNTPPPSAQPIGTSTLERFLKERRSAALRATPQDYGIQPQSVSPQPLLQNASLASNPIPIQSKPIQDRFQSTPPPLADEPTVVKSETYRPDGTQVQPAGFAPAQMGAAPPSVAQPKQTPQFGGNQQPQFDTPEWHKWADGYGRTSIQGETGHSSAFQGLREINTHDTNGSHSYGNYGLNSMGSAQDFVRQYGLDRYGLTAEPGTVQFDWQWREAASNPVTADVLRKAEIDYYNNHYVNPTVRGMSQYLPVNIANNRAAQEYLIDKSVQQGTGTWDVNSGVGMKHVRRAQQAAEESGGDPVKFVNRMAQLDHAAVGSDFPAALHSGAYSPLGDLNRLRTRVAGALGELGEGIQALPGQIGEGVRGVFGGGAKPQSVLDRTDLQPPSPGEKNIDRAFRWFGINPEQQQGLGGSLGTALGMNPSMDPQTANRLVGLGLGMMASGPSVGIPGLAGALSGTLTAFGKGGQYALNQEQQERAQAINLANAAMNQKLHEAQIQHLQAQIGQPQVRGETFDPTTFQWIKQYERYNPDTGTREPIPLGGKTGETTDITDIAPGLSGEAFIAEARKAGISPQHLEIAKQAAAYKDDPNKLYSSVRGNQRAIIDMLAHRINPDYEMTRYPAVADAEKKLYSGNTGQSISRIGRLFDEIAIANEAADNLKKQGASNYETINEQYSRFSKSNSPYAKARDALGYAIDNLSQSAASVAKGNNTQAEGDATRRFKLLNPDKAPDNLKNTFRLEAETALWNAQTNLTLANKAHGYTPDNQKYLSAFDFMNPAQKQKVLQILGADKVEEITGKPVTDADLHQSAKIFKTKEGKEFQLQQAKPDQSKAQPAIPQPQQAERATTPPRPANVPEGAGYSAKTGKWYDPVTHQPIE